MKQTQGDKILAALKQAGDNGLHPTYFIINLHIYQYTARIHEIREALGCLCRHSHTCSATEHIRNKDLHNGTTKFFYVNTSQEQKATMQKYTDDYHEEMKKDKSEQETLF